MKSVSICDRIPVRAPGPTTLRALIGIYSNLLARMAEKKFDVFTERVTLSTPEKCWIVLRAWMG